MDAVAKKKSISASVSNPHHPATLVTKLPELISMFRVFATYERKFSVYFRVEKMQGKG
jgi:hypothetical protein